MIGPIIITIAIKRIPLNMEESFENHDEENELNEDRLWPHDPDGPSWNPS